MTERTIEGIEKEMVEESQKAVVNDARIYTLQAERDALLIIQLRAERDALLAKQSGE